MKAPSGGKAAPTLAELRARLLQIPGELRALGVAIARGDVAPDVGDELGRLLDAEGQVIAMALAVSAPPRRLADEVLRAIEAPPAGSSARDTTRG